MIELAEERWAPCFEGLYEVSDRGRVCRIHQRKRRMLKPYRMGIHLAVSLYKNNVRHARSVHRLVAAAFIGPCPQGKEVNHINGIGTDNQVSNLEYVTRSENVQHALRLGLFNPQNCSRPGESNANSVLTLEQVQQIRAEKGRTIARVLAPRYGVAKSTILAVWCGQNWRNQ